MSLDWYWMEMQNMAEVLQKENARTENLHAEVRLRKTEIGNWAAAYGRTLAYVRALEAELCVELSRQSDSSLMTHRQRDDVIVLEVARLTKMLVLAGAAGGVRAPAECPLSRIRFSGI
jgi:pyridoxal biosynthesis lyase PdxS